jgi:hypothetical protein
VFVRAVVIVAMLGLSLPTPGRAATTPDPPPELRPVQEVVLVDESGSLSADDIAREREAALTIAQGEPSPNSTVSVVGFGSADATGQTPVGPICPPTRLDSSQNRQALANCVQQLHRRSPAEGNDTDYIAALSTALSYLDTPDAANQPKLVYLLTDGMLDVSNSPAYGNTPDNRNAAARQQLPGLLADLGHAGVQVWPLGFGHVDHAQLDSLAAGAAQGGCGATTPKPSATVITGSADLLRAIGAVSRSARCASVSDPVTSTLPEGGTVDLTVDVPAVASEGAILVFKRDARVIVSYRDPQGNTVPVNGAQGISRFALTGQGTGTEALQIANPTPGTWTVHLSAPPGVPTQDVTAVATFQGAVRAVLGVVPPSPQPGATVDVTMQVRGTRGAITDPAQLRGLTFLVGLSGDGFPPAAPVPLSDHDNHGDYQGQLTIPRTANGRLNFTGSVTGIGVSGDQRSFPTLVSHETAGVNAVLTLNGLDDDVIVGNSLQGNATVENSTGQPRTLRLEVIDQSPGAVISADPATLQLPAAGNAALNFKLRFDPATTLGANQARLRLVDESNGSVVGELLFSRNVVPEPTLFWRLLWLWALLAVVSVTAVVVALLLVRRAQRERIVRGIKVELRRNERVLGTVQARMSSTEFSFGIRTGDDAAISLGNGNGTRSYSVSRVRGKLVLRRPDGGLVNLVSGQAVNLGQNLTLVVHDRRSKAATEPRRPIPVMDAYSNHRSHRTSGHDDDPYLNV